MRSLVIASCALVMCLLPVGAQEKPVLDRFPIVAWGGPVTDEAELTAYQKANFTIVQVPAANADAIRLAGSLGLRAMLVKPQDQGGTPKDWAAFADTFDNVMGWLLADAVHADETPQLEPLIAELRAADQRRWPLISAPANTEGNWGAILGRLLRAGLPAMCYQRFSFYRDGTSDTDGFYADLEVARRISTKAHVPVWGMIQVALSKNLRWASPSDLRVQAYSYLAGGAKGLCYFTHWPSPEELRAAPVDEKEGPMDEAAGERRKQFALETITRINQEVLTLAPALLGLTSSGMYFAGSIPKSMAPLAGGGQLITSVIAEAALVGMFSDAKGQAWAMLVNRRHGKLRSAVGQKSTMQVFLDPRVKRIVEVDRVTAFEKEIPLAEGSFFVTIPGGTGCLFRLETQ